MITVREPEFQAGENHWNYQKASNGQETLTRRDVGTLEECASRALAFSPGTKVSAEAPFASGGLWTQDSATVEWDSPIACVLVRVYVRNVPSSDGGGSGSGGDEGGDDEPVIPESTTNASTQAIERPLTSAAFWADTFADDAESAASAMKAVQAYVNAEPGKELEAATEAWSQAFDEKYRNPVMKMIEKKLAGVESYYYPACSFSKTTYSSEEPESGVVGKISSAPEGAPDGLEWLKNGDSKSWNGAYWTHEESWLGADKWDEDLYGKA